MNILRVLAGVVGALVLPSGAMGQSFNIDIDVEAGGPEGGAGVPSSDFGAAANQPGFWTLLGAAQHTHAYPLFGLDGTTTAATVRWNVSGGGAGSGWMGNTGDYLALLNDCTVISVPTTYHFDGLLPGRYRIITYAVDRSGRTIPSEIRVPGSIHETQYSGQGGMTGNALVLGVTHCVHDLLLTGTSFQLTIRDQISDNPPDPNLAGFQITYSPVPEVDALWSFSLGLSALIAFRRRLW